MPMRFTRVLNPCCKISAAGLTGENIFRSDVAKSKPCTQTPTTSFGTSGRNWIPKAYLRTRSSSSSSIREAFMARKATKKARANTSVHTEQPRATILINLYDGTRELLAPDTRVLLRIVDGEQRHVF